jgi:plasmid maintenance system antidote protein VapI
MTDGREQLRDWMARRGVNQREAAALIGIHEVQFSQIMVGQRDPSLTTAVKIERRTGISIESWLLTDVSESDNGKPAIAGTARKTRR